MISDTQADRCPIEDELYELLLASMRAVVQHEAVCPGCQQRMRCPIYKHLVEAEQATFDAACRKLGAK